MAFAGAFGGTVSTGGGVADDELLSDAKWRVCIKTSSLGWGAATLLGVVLIIIWHSEKNALYLYTALPLLIIGVRCGHGRRAGRSVGRGHPSRAERGGRQSLGLRVGNGRRREGRGHPSVEQGRLFFPATADLDPVSPPAPSASSCAASISGLLPCVFVA